MKLRNLKLIRVAAWLAAGLIRAWMATVRYRLDPETARRHPADPRRERFIYAFWHESLLAPVVFRTPVHVLISLHADGELIAQACCHLGIGVVRGSTRRGGGAGLLELRDKSEHSHPVLMPDGPRGPRRTVQSGVVVLASRTGLPIVPVGIGYTRAWRARSWDRFAVPWPWSRITGVAAEPIVVPANLDRQGVEMYRQLVQERFEVVTAAAEAWAEELAGRARVVPKPHAPAQVPNPTAASRTSQQGR